MTVRSVVYKIHEEVGRVGQVCKHCFALPSKQEGKHKLPVSHIHLQVPSGVLSQHHSMISHSPGRSSKPLWWSEMSCRKIQTKTRSHWFLLPIELPSRQIMQGRRLSWIAFSSWDKWELLSTGCGQRLYSPFQQSRLGLYWMLLLTHYFIMQIYMKRSKVTTVSFVEKSSCEHTEQLWSSPVSVQV